MAAAWANAAQVSNPQARQSHGLPLRTQADRLEHFFHPGRIGPHQPRLDLEDGSVARHHRVVHHRLPAAGRLAALHHRPAPEQLFARTRERVIQPPLVGQQVHEAQVEPIDRHRPRQTAQLLEPRGACGTACSSSRASSSSESGIPPASAQVPAMLARDPGEVCGLRQGAHAAEPEQLLQVLEGDRRIQLRPRPAGGQTPAYTISSPSPHCARRYRASASAGNVTGARYGTSSG